MANVVLMYHNISEHGQCILFHEWSPTYDIVYNTFVEHLDVIEKCPNDIVLTFDDGYQSIHKFALPLVNNNPALDCQCFITTGTIGQEGMLTKNQIRELMQNNIRIGAHSHTHVFLEKLGRQQLEQEILQPKKTLEEITGTEITEMSLPGGRYDRRTIEFAARCGYQKIYTSVPGTKPMSISKIPGLVLVPRWAITFTTTAEDLENIVNLRSLHIAAQKAQYLAGKLAKRIFGNRGYHAYWHAVHRGRS